MFKTTKSEVSGFLNVEFLTQSIGGNPSPTGPTNSKISMGFELVWAELEKNRPNNSGQLGPTQQPDGQMDL